MPKPQLLAELADSRSMIEHRTIEGALLLGPAVLIPLDGVTFERNTWSAPEIDALFIEMPHGKKVVGVIGVREITFRDCEFQNVALAGTPESLARFRQEFMAGNTTYSTPSVSLGPSA